MVPNPPNGELIELPGIWTQKSIIFGAGGQIRHKSAIPDLREICHRASLTKSTKYLKLINYGVKLRSTRMQIRLDASLKNFQTYGTARNRAIHGGKILQAASLSNYGELGYGKTLPLVLKVATARLIAKGQALYERLNSFLRELSAY